MTKRVLLVFTFFSVMANADQVASLSPINDGMGTIGTLSDFMVVNGSVDINNAGSADILLNFNSKPSANLTPYVDFGVTLSVTDLLFQVGSDNYGIPIVSHSGAPNGGNASLFASVTAGDFYQTTNLLTAQTVLNNPGLIYRNNANVWLGNTVTDLGTLTETITSQGSTPEYTVEFKGQLPASFLADANAHGFKAEFGSATCGNGYLVGSAAPVPEPTQVIPLVSLLLALSVRHLIGVRRSRMK